MEDWWNKIQDFGVSIHGVQNVAFAFFRNVVEQDLRVLVSHFAHNLQSLRRQEELVAEEEQHLHKNVFVKVKLHISEWIYQVVHKPEKAA